MNRMKRHHWLLMALLCAVWALALLELESGADRPPRANPSQGPAVDLDSAGPPSVPIAVDGAADPYKPGTVRSYKAVLDTRFGAGPASENFVAKVSASLELQLIDSSSGGHFFAARLRAPAMQVGDGAGTQKRANPALLSDLAVPLYVRTDREGRIQELSIRPDLQGMAQTVQRHLIAALQFVQPRGVRAEGWTVEESDASAVCSVKYKRLDGDSYHKRRLECHGHSLESMGGKPSIEGTAKLTLTPHRIVRHAHVREQVDAHLGDAVFSAHTQIRLDLTALRSAPIEPPALAGLERTALHQLAAMADSALPSDEELVGGATADQLIDALVAARGDEARDARWDAQHRLVALFRHDERAAGRALERLSSLEPEDQQMLLGALTDSSSPSAQRALLDLAQSDDQERDTQLHAVSHLALVEQPTAETVSGLSELVDTVGDDEQLQIGGMLALGAAAGRLARAEQGAEQGQAAIDRLVQSFAQASDPGQRMMILGALGNAQSPRALDAILPGLGDDNPDVRASAAEALRAVRSEEVDGVIGQTMTGDESARVRRHAILAAQGREPTPTLLQALDESLKGDSDPRVRMRVVTLAGERLDEHDAFESMLNWAAENDPDSQVRKIASQLLSRSQDHGGGAEADQG